MPFRSPMVAYVDLDGTVLQSISDFTPIAPLWDNATDVCLFFLSGNGVLFIDACHDPWYSATTIFESPNNETYYVSDELVGVLGCVSRYQFCNADPKSGKSCTPLAGYRIAVAATEALWQIHDHRSLLDVWLEDVMIFAVDVHNIVSVAGIASLKARDTLSGGLQGPLLNNQWQVEVENWYGAILAGFQKRTVDYATGPTEPALLQILQRPRTESERQFCQNVVSVFFFILFIVERLFLFLKD